MRWSSIPAVGLALLAVMGCRSESAGPDVGLYCEVVEATHDQVLEAYEQNSSGTPRSETAIPSVMAARSAVAPSEIAFDWTTLLAGPGSEADGEGAGQKSDDYEAALTTIGAYDQRHCGVTPDLAAPRTVTVR